VLRPRLALAVTRRLAALALLAERGEIPPRRYDAIARRIRAGEELDAAIRASLDDRAYTR
jgi:hypothetical protein